MHLRLSVINWPPVSVIVPQDEGGIEIEGVMKHMLQIMAKHCNFSYTLIQPSSGHFGSFVNGSWNGLVGTLVDNKSDIAFNGIADTASRHHVIDYSKPVYSHKYNILSLKQSLHSDLGLIEYLLAVNLHVWLHILSIILIIAIINSMIISKWKIRCRDDIIDFFWTFLTQLWNLLEIILVEFQWKRTRRYTSSYISILFLFFALLALIFSVIMNAFVGVSFIVGNTIKMIDSWEQMAREKDIIPVIIGGGSMENLVRSSNSEATKIIWRRIQEHRDEALLPGRQHIKDENFLHGMLSGKYAFIFEKNILKQVKLDCCLRNPNVDLHISVDLVRTVMAGLGFRKGLDNKVVREVDNVIERLVISGLTNRWFEDGYSKFFATHSSEIKECFDDVNSDTNNYSSIGLEKTTFMMLITIFLWDFSFVILIFEISLNFN